MTARIAALLTLALLAAPAAAGEDAPDARRVIVRGGRGLADRLASATREAWKGERPRAVAIVVDVTPNTKARAGAIRDALESLGDRVMRLDGAWRIGRLGGAPGDPVRHPSALTVTLPSVLAKETPEVNTIRALRRTLSPFRDRGGLVVYLADWRFEDDQGLEPLVARLKRRDQSLRVIGSEAAFGRPWTDAFRPSDPNERYERGVGRSPFENDDADAPWHGGDTAYPAIPWSFGVVPWRTEFTLGTLGRDPEDLLDRLREKRAARATGFAYPLSSAWGPWGLMRAAAETGGRYYLHSWNPGGRTDLAYDYSRCNLFAPDLRPRAAILADVARRPLPAAMMKAWNRIAGPTRGLARITPPAERGRPREMERAGLGGSRCGAWLTRGALETWLRKTGEDAAALDDAIRILGSALERPEGDGPAEARYRADARLFLHTLRVLRFQLGEARLAARTVPDDAWSDPDVVPGLHEEVWIEKGRDPDRIEVNRSVRLFDPPRGERLLAARERHLRRYGGTPFGETVARNPVVGYRIGPWFVIDEPGRPAHASRTPSESRGETSRTPEPTGEAPPRPEPRRAPGGSSGGGPASGR